MMKKLVCSFSHTKLTSFSQILGSWIWVVWTRGGRKKPVPLAWKFPERVAGIFIQAFNKLSCRFCGRAQPDHAGGRMS